MALPPSSMARKGRSSLDLWVCFRPGLVYKSGLASPREGWSIVRSNPSLLSALAYDSTIDVLPCFFRPVKVLTHCNTGSLATAGFGTALGVIRAINAQGRCVVRSHFTHLPSSHSITSLI